jgi:hypothetical protein
VIVVETQPETPQTDCTEDVVDCENKYLDENELIEDMTVQPIDDDQDELEDESP